MSEQTLTNNQLAFLALANEYCHAIESASEYEREEFVDLMLRLLPRLYMSATDQPDAILHDEDAYLPSALSEDYYDAVRRQMEMLLGEDDTYLEVFEEDMKYSDTPIAASIAESLADIFQVLYNLTENVKDAPMRAVEAALEATKEEFKGYWSQTLCNVLRPLNAIKYQ